MNINYIKDKWEEFDIRLFIISLMYRGSNVYVDVVPKHDAYQPVDHGKIVDTKDLGDGKTLNVYEDGATSISGSNESGQLGLDNDR